VERLLAIKVCALPAQVPDEDPDPQEKDHQQGYGQGHRLPMDSAAQEETQCAQNGDDKYSES
jgi:hypothetical protein